MTTESECTTRKRAPGYKNERARRIRAEEFVDGIARRDFLQAGALGALGLSLADYTATREQLEALAIELSEEFRDQEHLHASRTSAVVGGTYTTFMSSEGTNYCTTREGARLVAEAWTTFKQELGGVEYKPLLPVGQDPPADLNRDLMEAFRPAMREHYLKRQPEFV